jgi:hypothetical protein
MCFFCALLGLPYNITNGFVGDLCSLRLPGATRVFRTTVSFYRPKNTRQHLVLQCRLLPPSDVVCHSYCTSRTAEAD